MSQVQGVSHAKRLVAKRQTGSVDADSVAEQGVDIRLVNGNPVFHPVMECFVGNPGVAQEHGGGLGIEPAALFLHGLGQIPVIQRRHDFDVCLS